MVGLEIIGQEVIGSVSELVEEDAKAREEDAKHEKRSRGTRKAAAAGEEDEIRELHDDGENEITAKMHKKKKEKKKKKFRHWCGMAACFSLRRSAKWSLAAYADIARETLGMSLLHYKNLTEK